MNVHLPMYFAFTVPLLVAEAVRTVKDREAVRPLRVGILLFVTYLCSIYFFVFGGIAYVAIILVGSIRTDRLRDNLAKIGLVVVIASVAMSPFIAARHRPRPGGERSGRGTGLARGHFPRERGWLCR